jgi:hypothetical protein
MLICFGALFPPLAVIIALSVLKDVMSIRLALGRYCEIMEAVQDGSLKEQMVKVRESMDEEMLKAGAGIWNGVWYGLVMGTWIWGFVLFDTMASTEGAHKGWVLIIVLCLCPLIVYAAVHIALHYKHNEVKTDFTESFIDSKRSISNVESDDNSWIHMQDFTKNALIEETMG